MWISFSVELNCHGARLGTSLILCSMHVILKGSMSNHGSTFILQVSWVLHGGTDCGQTLKVHNVQVPDLSLILKALYQKLSSCDLLCNSASLLHTLN